MDKPVRVIMLPFERGFLDPRSSVSARLARFASPHIRITAIVVVHAGKASVDHRGDVRVIGLPGGALRRVWGAFWQARREIRQARANGETPILTAQDPFIAGSIAFSLSRLLGVPYEIQEHGDYFSGAWAHEAVANRCLIFVGLFILRRAEAVRVVSERIRDRLVQRGVSAGRIHVTPVIQEGLSVLLEQTLHMWSSAAPTLVAPCRFVKQKGLEVLLHACAQLVKEGFSFRLRLIGEGPEGERIGVLARDLGVQDHVTFEPWSDSLSIWDGADLFVLSSHYEGWGRTIVEAMAAGVPVVTTDVGCVGSLFRPQIDGRVVPPGDARALAAAIREQMQEADRRTWMVEQARSRIGAMPAPDVLVQRQQGAWKEIARTSATVSRRGWLVPVSLVAFATAVRALSVAWFWPSLGAHREWGFYTLVANWFQGYGYSFATDIGCLSAQRAPGFLFFLTAVYGIFGLENFLAQAIIQNLLAILLVYLVYRLGWRLSGVRWVGIVAGMIAAVHPYTFYHYTQYYHTVLSAVLLVGLVLALLALERTRAWRWAIGVGALTAALAYVQGTILVAMPFLAVWLLLRWRDAWKRGILLIAVVALVSAGLIAPWTWRNWKAFHAFVPLTTDLGFAFYKANNENYESLLRMGFPHEALVEEKHPTEPFLVRYRYLPEVEQALQSSARGLQDAAFWTMWHPQEPVRAVERCELLPPIDEVGNNQHWMGLGTAWIRDHYWPDVARLQIQKALTFWSPTLYPWVRYGASWSFGDTGVMASAARIGLWMYVAFLELFAVIGAWQLARRREDRWRMWPIGIVLIAYTIMHTFFAPYTKYRIPLDAMVAAFAGMGVWEGWRWGRSWWRR
ncbi:MAG: hypothetical protein RL141_666 [Candidatus Parcubacteria bacterium]|jgi:glycosyltransferase involved in cell wall biosynthesis